MSEDDGGSSGSKGRRKRPPRAGATPPDEPVDEASEAEAPEAEASDDADRDEANQDEASEEEAPARPSGRRPRSRRRGADEATTPTPSPPPEPEPEPEIEQTPEPASGPASGPADDVYVWHDPAPRSGKGVAVAAVLGLLAGLLIGGLGWAAFGSDDDDDSGTTTVAAPAEGGDVATTPELVVQCTFPDFPTCNTVTVPEALSDWCFGGPTAIEIPGKAEGADASVLLTVQQVADVTPGDTEASRVTGSETSLVSCADVTQTGGGAADDAETTTTTAATPAEG